MKEVKRRFLLFSVLVLMTVLVLALASCSNECTAHSDKNGDGKCDSCNVAVEAKAPECKTHTDKDKNAICDVCGKRVECSVHVDADKNAECDVCGSFIECKAHVDANKNAKCDVCNEYIPCKIHTDRDKNAVCDVCGQAVECKVHSDLDKNAECDVCGKFVECKVHTDLDKNAKCDVCGITVVCSVHLDADKNAKCDVCGTSIKCKTHMDSDKNAICDVCGDTVECKTHVDANRDSICDVCSNEIFCEEHTDIDKNAKCDVCGDAIVCDEHVDADKNSRCDVCGKSISCFNHVDSDRNAKCDVCGTTIVCDEHIDADRNARCDACGKYIPCDEHIDIAPRDTLCDVCGAYVPCTNHADVYPRDAKCDACGADVDCKTHSDVNEDAICDVCGKEVPCDTHTDVLPFDNYCDRCGQRVECSVHSDIDANGVCDRCGKSLGCDPHEDANNDNRCDVCKSFIPCAVHTDSDKNNVCDKCGAFAPCDEHIDSDENYVCDRCGERIPCATHIDSNSDLCCDRCGEEMPCKTHRDTNSDSYCDICGTKIPCKTHRDTNSDTYCDVCGEKVSCSSHRDTNRDQACDNCGAYVPCTSHVDYDKNAHCDYCNTFIPCATHVNANGDRLCDVCGETLPCDHVDTNPRDAKCDNCGEALPCDHEDADGNKTCDICSAELPCDHVDENPRDTECDVCGRYVACKSHVDSNRNGECDFCGASVPVEAIKLTLIKPTDMYIEPNFQFVIAKSAPASVRSVLSKFITQIKSEFGIEIRVVNEGNSDDIEQEVEVLVGDVKNRGEEYLFDRYSLGPKGYMAKVVNTKVLINAGTEKTFEDAIGAFMTEILGIEDDRMIDGIVIDESDSIIEIQTDFKITSLSVAGNSMKGYTIAVDSSNDLYVAAAKVIQDSIYSRVGYWLEIVPISEAGDRSIVIRSKAKVYSDESFTVKAMGTALIIECAFENKLSDTIAAFTRAHLTGKTGDVDLVGTVYKKDISVVYYEEFGAKGDGITDDYQAIYDTHVFANKSGQLVRATPDARYYLHYSTVIVEGIKNPVVRTIPIMTNVDWTGAEFIIDDSDINYHNKVDMENTMATTHIFTPTSDYSTITIKDTEILNAIGPVGEAYGTTKIDLDLGYPALLVIYNADHKVYRRSGASYMNETTGTNSGGDQHELILIDAEGNIDPSTPFMFDYSRLTRIDVIRTDIEPITIKGGVVTTIACGLDANYVEGGVVKEFSYYNRGINVNRSYTTVDGVKHFVVGEISMEQQALGIEGAYYHGFLYGSSATDITFKDCQVQGRRYYGLNGTYDLGGNLVNNLNFIGCDQINFWIDAEGNVSDFEKGELSMRVNYFDTDTAYKKSVRHCWGVGGTNYCKNMNYIDSRLSRFDAHCGLYNGSVINSELTFFAITGKGTFEVRNTKWYSAGEGQTDNSLIYMRGDYGSTWEGDVILDNVTAYVSGGDFYMLFHSYNNWDYGYKCYIPNIEINNLSLYSVKSKQPLDDNIEITFVSGGKDDYMHLDETKTTSPKAIIMNPDTGLYELIKDTTGQYEFNHISGIYEINTDAPLTAYRNHNPIGMPDYIKITNNTHNYKFVLKRSDDPNFYWANTKFYYSDTEYYLGTNHSRTETFLFT